MSSRRKPLQGIKIIDCNKPHAGLWLDKFISDQDKNNKTTRPNLISEVARLSVPDGYNMFYKRWIRMLEDYKQAGCAVQWREAQVCGRMVVGTGNESVLETAVTLHRTYGVPYIPGSALKGLAAGFARQYCGADWKNNTENYKIVFGDTAESGCMVFFDAMLDVPGNSRPLNSDVLTPHHKDYYMKSDSPPADWDDPNPVHFLSATGNYLIALAATEGGDEWIEAVFKILDAALKELGIGAKTSSGYGRMRFIESK